MDKVAACCIVIALVGLGCLVSVSEGQFISVGTPVSSNVIVGTPNYNYGFNGYGRRYSNGYARYNNGYGNYGNRWSSGYNRGRNNNGYSTGYQIIYLTG